MILSVTPNATIDRTLIVPGYATGGVFRPIEQTQAAGGKGINVARVVRLLGGDAMCTGFVAGFSGAHFTEMAEKEGLPALWTRLEGRETRTCTLLVDPEADISTMVNEYGPMVGYDDWARLRADVLSVAEGASAVCFCGSLPPGSSMDVFTGLLSDLISGGIPVWVDTSGRALEATIGVPGVNIKINGEEYAELTGTHPRTGPQALTAARQLFDYVGGSVAITLGQQGAVWADQHGAWRAEPPHITAKSTVGSGDAFLAALLFALESSASTEDALRQAVAAGAANALSLGPGSFDLTGFRQLLSRVRVMPLM